MWRRSLSWAVSSNLAALVLLPAFVVFLGCVPAYGKDSYTLTDLGTLGGNYSVANGINATGQIVGEAATAMDGIRHAFLYENGQIVDLGTLHGAGNSTAAAINDAGQIAGDSDATDNFQHAFRYSDGKMTDLFTLGPGGSTAKAINNAGTVTGYSSYPAAAGAQSRAFVSGGNGMSSLGNIGGGSTYAYAINDLGQVAGVYTTEADPLHERGFIYMNEGFTALPPSSSAAFGINAAGKVCGDTKSSENAPEHAATFYKGHILTLGKLSGYGYAGATAINKSGAVVGVAFSDSLPPKDQAHGFLYRGTMKDLNKLRPAGSEWVLQAASSINDFGQIVGYGQNPDGDTHGFLLSPVRPTVTLLADRASISRGAGEVATITFTRHAGAVGSLVVHYKITGLRAGKDYEMLSGATTIPENQTTAAVAITPKAGGANGNLKLSLISKAAYAISAPKQAAITISP